MTMKRDQVDDAKEADIEQRNDSGFDPEEGQGRRRARRPTIEFETRGHQMPMTGNSPGAGAPLGT